MSNAKLMTPLFYQGNFNADGKKMRAILVREVSNGTDTYRLWRRSGGAMESPTGRGPATQTTPIFFMWNWADILPRSV